MSDDTRPHLDLTRLREVKPREMAIRFAFGGVVTAGAGVIAHQFGPVIGGLFLAFPSILPASLTLLEKHNGTKVAGMDSLGAALGSIGLIGFAVVAWRLAERLPPAVALVLALATWTVLRQAYGSSRVPSVPSNDVGAVREPPLQ